MASDEQKRIAIQFLDNFNHADPEVFARLITDEFRFEIVSSLKEFPADRRPPGICRQRGRDAQTAFSGWAEAENRDGYWRWSLCGRLG